MKTRSLGSLVAILFVAGCLLGGCDKGESEGEKSTQQGTPEGGGADTVAVVNARCPIMGTKLDRDNVPADLTRTFEGKKVGFCCAGCPEKWDELTEAEKRRELQAAMGGEPPAPTAPAKPAAPGEPGEAAKPAEAATVAVVNVKCPMTGKEIDRDDVPANLTREFKGKKVGFCCPDCLPAWDKLTEAEKAEKLAVAAPMTK